MLEKKCRARLRLECQRGAGRALAQPDWYRKIGDLGPDNIAPAQDQCGIGEAPARDCSSGQHTGIGSDRSTAPPAGINRLGRVGYATLCALRSLSHGDSERFAKSWNMPVLRGRQGPRVEALLAWYDVHRRVLPWRAQAGMRADPYHVWLSEIMLQQTTVQAVDRYYRTFLSRWPTVEQLAAASLDDVLAAWAGLGYYARARNLHRTAKIVAGQMAGRFPETAVGLRALPGIGPYTAGAIAAIAFDEPQAAVDANAERVIARLFYVKTPLPAAKAELRARTQALVPQRRAGDFAQAVMDLGALICTPKAPQCPRCPWQEACIGRVRGLVETLPRKAPKPDRPLKRGVAFVVVDAKGAVLLQRRAEKGLLGGMMQPPLGPWGADFPAEYDAMTQAPFAATWIKRPGLVRHQFTHFELEIEVYVAKLTRRPRIQGRWVQAHALAEAALPTVMRKILVHGLGTTTFAPA